MPDHEFVDPLFLSASLLRDLCASAMKIGTSPLESVPVYWTKTAHFHRQRRAAGSWQSAVEDIGGIYHSSCRRRLHFVGSAGPELGEFTHVFRSAVPQSPLRLPSNRRRAGIPAPPRPHSLLEEGLGVQEFRDPIPATHNFCGKLPPIPCRQEIGKILH